MLRRLLSKIQFNLSLNLILLSISAVYLGVTVPAIWQDHHQLFNLEPYPDGLLYALTARNYLLNGTFALEYQDSQLVYWVPPLYSLVLIIGYLIEIVPQTFVVVNIFLGLLAVCLLLVTVWKLTYSPLATLLSGMTYLSHIYLIWLTNLPIAENLSLSLFCLGLLGLSNLDSKSSSWPSLVLLSSVGLAATKFVSIPVAICLVVLTVTRLIHLKRYKHLLLISSGGLFSSILYIFLINNPLPQLVNFIKEILSGSIFFSTEFIYPNLRSYLLSLVLKSGHFLWQSTPLSSVFVFGSFLVSCLLLILTNFYRKQRWFGFSLLVLFLSQFPVLLLFYVVDTRYIILSVPLFAIAFGILVKRMLRYKQIYVFLSFGGLLIAHLLTQRPLIKEVIAANLFGKTVGWQYESIKHFDEVLIHLPGSYLITALPPFLTDAYSTASYRVLPISINQEFIQKNQWVWGNDLPAASSAADLYQIDINLLQNHTPLYITNAYITHQQGVIDDYEDYKKVFNFTLVSEGCMQACNIYQLTLPDSATNSAQI